MRRPPRILVLDFGASRVAGAVFLLSQSGRLVLERFAQEPHAMRFAADDEAAVRSRVLAALAVRESWRGACVLAVPGDQALVKFIKVPPVEAGKREQIIKFEAAQSIPYALEEVCWDKFGLGGARGEEEWLVTAIKTEAMMGLCGAMAAARLEPQQAMPGCFALWRAWQYNYGADAESALIVDVGARSTRLVFATPRRCHLRTLALGGNVLTQAIADELKVEMDQAEQLKIRLLDNQKGVSSDEDLPAREVVELAAERFTRRLQMEVARAVLGQARRVDAISVTQILLTGGGARWHGLAEALSAKLELPVRVYDALRGVEVSEQAEGAEHQLAVLTGLAVAVLKTETASINLLPATIQAARTKRKARPWWLATAVLLVVAAIPPAWHFHALAKAAKAEDVRLERELAPLRRMVANNTDTLARLATAQGEVKALRTAMAARTAWTEFLADLQRELNTVEDVWLERMVIVDAAVNESAVRDAKSPSLRLALSGRLLDVRNPVSKISADSDARVRELLARIAASRFVTGIEAEQFDNSRPGMLRFDFILAMNPEQPL